MNRNTLLKKAGLMAVLVGVTTSSFAIESGDIESRVGFIDESTGAKVEAVERGEQSGEYRVLISIPGKDDAAPVSVQTIFPNLVAMNL